MQTLKFWSKECTKFKLKFDSDVFSVDGGNECSGKALTIHKGKATRGYKRIGENICDFNLRLYEKVSFSNKRYTKNKIVFKSDGSTGGEAFSVDICAAKCN